MVKAAWEFREESRNVHVFRHPNCPEKWEQHYLVISDVHWDNPHCEWKLLKEHCDEAVQRNAPIIVVGDFFCAMQGKFDKRSDKSSIRPEHQSGDYIDALVRTAAEWWNPYKEILALVGYGNHETAILKNHETDLLQNFTYKLREQGGIARTGGYGGWIRWQHHRSTQRSSHTMFYHHGFGGGGPVTKGAIDFNRMAEWTDADILASGHVHWKGAVPIARVRLNDAQVVQRNDGYYMRLGTYKDEYRDGAQGWMTERGQGPRPLGGYWVRFYRKANKVCMDVQDAK